MMYMPTEGQQAFLSLMFIPGSILSILGSSLIIRNVRQQRTRSSYRNIMLVSSMCDIVFSAVWILQPFLSPGDIPDAWIYAVGNQATCSVLGGFTQFGLSAHWYAGLLSFYFVSTIRFGVKQTTFAKVLPYLQGFILLWSITTAAVAGAMEQYSPSGTSPGCWIGSDGCVDVHDCTTTYIVGWAFGGFPTVIMLLCVVVNNMILYCHVRRTVIAGQRRALEAETALSMYGSTKGLGSLAGVSNHSGSAPSKTRGGAPAANNNNASASLNSKSWHSFDFSLGTSKSRDNGDDRSSTLQHQGGGRSKRSRLTRGLSSGNLSVFTDAGSAGPKKKSVLRSSDKEWKRVREVGKQSFLYVGAYFLSFGWTFVVNALDSSNYEYNEDAGSYFLPLLVGQSILLPTMGFFNCCIYFRPKVLANSRQFPKESKIWWIKRAIHGEVIKPTVAKNNNASPPRPPMFRINLETPAAISGLKPAESEANEGREEEGSTQEMMDEDDDDVASFAGDDNQI